MQQRRSRMSFVVLCFLVGNLVCFADGAAQTPSPTPTPVLTLSQTGEGMGEILVDGVVVCPVGCQEITMPFHEGDTLTIDALPSSGSFLEGWNMNGIPVTPVSGGITVMPGDRVTAIFRLATSMSSALASCEVFGDIDENGSVTLIDALLLSLFCRGFPVEIAEACSDVSCDGEISCDDAWLIWQYVFGWIAEFPCSPPVADFTADPLSGPLPLTVVFTNESRGAVTQYEWSFGDGATSSEEHPQHTYTTAGSYAVSLKVSGPGGADELTKPEYIEALPNQAPTVTITSPADGAVVASGTLQVSGTVVDDGTVVSVLVNNTPATLVGEHFSATISVDNGNQVIHIVAEDHGNTFGVAERLVRVDGEGPLIGIHSPKRGQSVYTLHPHIDITYSDLYSAVDTASLSVQLVDENNVPTDITGDLTITDAGAQGTLSTPLTGDTTYMLTISISDALGNVSQNAATFYVPLDPASIVPPVENEGDGWVTGRVFDSSACNDHLQGCEPLAGARVTLSTAGDSGDPVPGVLVTGPEGFFAFPLPETGIYWIRVEHSDYTYAQREVEVVRQRSTAAGDIYLTPLDSAVTSCDETGCSHTSSDGILQVEIPAGAIPAGQTVEVRVTNFRHVEFLPSGSLPPGTWETYAFNLGGDSEVTFNPPVSVKIQNYRGFAPGTEIPLGYWNQSTQCWEHEGVGSVDATGEWVVMWVTHFSNFDCNDPVTLPEGATTEVEDLTGGEPGPCADGTQKCFIDVKSGTFTEDYSLPSVSVLGQDLAPQLLYSSRQAVPSAVIDIAFSMSFADPNVEFGDYLGMQLSVEGHQTDAFSIAADLQANQEYRYRYFWDGRDAQGNLLPSGVYAYLVKLNIPYRTQYYWSRTGRFGGPPDYTRPTGVFVNASEEIVVRGTITLNTQSESPFGVGWTLAGQQRLVEDEAGRILISAGKHQDEFAAPPKNLLRQARAASDGVLVWANYGWNANSIQVLPESLARNWDPQYLDVIRSLDVEDEAYDLTLSVDGQYAYVAAEGHGGETLPIVELCGGELLDRITVDYQPAGIALSPDERYAYVAHWGSNALAVVDLTTRQTIASIPLEGTGWTAVAVSPDGAYAYVLSRYYDNKVAVVDLDAREVLTYIGVGANPTDIALSPEGRRAYVVNSGDDTVSVLDLETRQPIDSIPVGSAPQSIALSATGTKAYITNRGDNTVSVVDLETYTVSGTISVGSQPHGIVVAWDGNVAYVTNQGNNTISVVDLILGEVFATIPTGSQPTGIALVSNADPTSAALTETDHSWLEYEGGPTPIPASIPMGPRCASIPMAPMTLPWIATATGQAIPTIPTARLRRWRSPRQAKPHPAGPGISATRMGNWQRLAIRLAG